MPDDYMFNTLMDISEAETGAMKLSMENVDLTALIDEGVELYNFVAEDRGVTVSVNSLTSRTVRARYRRQPPARMKRRRLVGNLSKM